MIEIPFELGIWYSGRSIDHLVVSKNFRHCVRHIRVEKNAPWSVHVAVAFDVMRNVAAGLSITVDSADAVSMS